MSIAEELIRTALEDEGYMIHYLEINNYTGEIPKQPDDIRVLLLELAIKELKNGKHS